MPPSGGFSPLSDVIFHFFFSAKPAGAYVGALEDNLVQALPQALLSFSSELSWKR
jgi:hypothetical protein